MYATLPKNEVTFNFHEVGSQTGIVYDGQFTVKCILSISDKHVLELEKTRLMADYANPSNGLAGIAITLSTLHAKIIDSPQWWKDLSNGYSMLDEDVIMKLYDKCVEVENKWKESLREMGAKSEPKANP